MYFEILFLPYGSHHHLFVSLVVKAGFQKTPPALLSKKKHPIVHRPQDLALLIPNSDDGTIRRWRQVLQFHWLYYQFLKLVDLFFFVCYFYRRNLIRSPHNNKEQEERTIVLLWYRPKVLSSHRPRHCLSSSTYGTSKKWAWEKKLKILKKIVFILALKINKCWFLL